MVLTNAAFMLLESPFGYGVYTANATQLAKIVTKIKYSNGLDTRVKANTNRDKVEMLITALISGNTCIDICHLDKCEQTKRHCDFNNISHVLAFIQRT